MSVRALLWGHPMDDQPSMDFHRELTLEEKLEIEEQQRQQAERLTFVEKALKAIDPRLLDAT